MLRAFYSSSKILRHAGSNSLFHHQRVERFFVSNNAHRKEKESNDEKEKKIEEQLAKNRKLAKPSSRINFAKEPECEFFLSYINCRENDKAEKILFEFHKKHAVIPPVLVNRLLQAWFKQDNWQRGWDLYNNIFKDKLKPNTRTFTSLIGASIRFRKTNVIPELLERMKSLKIRPERLLGERLHLKEGVQIPYIILEPEKVDPNLAIKIPPGCTLPNGYIPKDPGLIYNEESLFHRQQQREKSLVAKRTAEFKRDITRIREIGRGAFVGDARKLLLDWFPTLEAAISAAQLQYQADSSKPLPEFKQHLINISADKMAVIILFELMSQLLLDQTGAKISLISENIGNAVQAEILFYENRGTLSVRQRKDIVKRAQNTRKRLSMISYYCTEVDLWSAKVITEIGAEMLNIAINTLTLLPIDGTNQPAFKHDYRTVQRGKRTGIIKCHPMVFSHIDPLELHKECYDPKLLPTIVPPKPWTDINNGGYLCAPTRLMRSFSKHQHNALRTVDLSDFYEVMNIISAVPWKINQNVFRVVEEAWERGGGYPYMPIRSSISFPPPPENFKSSPEARLDWRRQRKKAERKNGELHSLRCDFSLKLFTAKSLLHEPCFYFPHNIDFRGRTYPIPPHLNHMGHDLSRAVLQFAVGKPLGANGLFWLKAHLGSLYGLNKVSYEERVKFVDDNMEDIIDSATDPLSGRRWWLNADSAWQALGVCFELKEISEMKDPSKFISYIPVHKDGSCNGLQHYAALGGDIEGGRSVNLIPADAPQDVYSHVLKNVLRALHDDAEKGHPLATKLLGNVVRKTIKQTVMTYVYGVTKIGARAQICGQLKDQGIIADEDLFSTSNYLTGLTFDAMQSMFDGARKIMTWLGDIARIVSKSGEPMSWTTPIGIPVEQHYRRAGKQQVKTLLQSITLMHTDDLPVLVQKQRTAFPPNYVHSLDSSHMYYTAKICHQSGITFAAVHDSYWTHACDIDTLNTHLREAFITLHSRPLLEELRTELMMKHPNVEIPPFPERGPLDINLVRNSRYFFH